MMGFAAYWRISQAPVEKLQSLKLEVILRRKNPYLFKAKR